MTGMQAGLLVGVGAVAFLDQWPALQAMISRPIVIGPVVGAILGAPAEGVLWGAALEAMQLAVLPVGAARYPDAALAGLLGTTAALTGMAGGVYPCGLGGRGRARGGLGRRRGQPHAPPVERPHGRAGSCPRGGGAPRGAGSWDRGRALPRRHDRRGSDGIGLAIVMAGARLVKGTAWAGPSTRAACGSLPPRWSPLARSASSAFGRRRAVVLGFRRARGRGSREVGRIRVTAERGLSRRLHRERRKIALRSTLIQAVWNYDSLRAVGFGWAILPGLERIQPDRTARAKRLHEHLEGFNANPYLATIAMGMTLRMEEEIARGAAGAERRLARLLRALRGSLGAIGDDLFWAGWRPALGATAAIAALATGSIWPAVLYLLAWNALAQGVRVAGVRAGFAGGAGVARVLQDLLLVQGAAMGGPRWASSRPAPASALAAHGLSSTEASGGQRSCPWQPRHCSGWGSRSEPEAESYLRASHSSSSWPCSVPSSTQPTEPCRDVRQLSRIG